METGSPPPGRKWRRRLLGCLLIVLAVLLVATLSMFATVAWLGRGFGEYLDRERSYRQHSQFPLKDQYPAARWHGPGGTIADVSGRVI